MKWYNFPEIKPLDAARVIYFAPQVGVWRGAYDEEAYVFHGEGGFIDAEDVTHWMYDKGQLLPPRPATNV